MRPDHALLTGQAYADDSHLSARISIYAYQRPRLDLVRHALERLGPVDGPVLDVGWGTGAYTRALREQRPGRRVIPLDLSPGLRPEVVAEVDRLPFATEAAGAALAMHMLYYATDQRAALAELHRVLRPGGRLAVSTNGEAANTEWRGLWRSALRDLGVADPPPYPRTDGPFLLERAHELVAEAFGNAELAEHRSEIVVPCPEPVLAYLSSNRAEQTRFLPAGVPWDAYAEAAARRVRAEVEAAGAFRITGHAGVLTATKAAGVAG
jgi:SAM-dependent methyltransferase